MHDPQDNCHFQGRPLNYALSTMDQEEQLFQSGCIKTFAGAEKRNQLLIALAFLAFLKLFMNYNAILSHFSISDTWTAIFFLVQDCQVQIKSER